MDGQDGTTRIYRVTGNDHLDDPAWGIDPVFSGSEEAAIAWLQSQLDISQYSVMRDLETVWAA